MFELKEFFIEGHNHDKSHVILHITEPSSNDVKKGYFFALAEIQNGGRDEIIEMEKIFDDLEKSYYSTQDSKEKTALELSLEFINRRAQEVLKESDAEIDCFVGVLEDFHITFSTHGSPLGVLFYSKEGKLGHLSIIDPEETSGRQFFSSLTEGDLNMGDSLLIATPQINEFFSVERLEKLILTRSTHESVDHIHKVLKQLRSGNSYGGALFKNIDDNPPEKVIKKTRDLQKGSVASIDSLVQREKDTASTLSPPLFHDTREKVKNYMDEKKETLNTPATRTSKLRRENREESKTTDIILMVGRGLLSTLRSIIFIFVGLFRIFQSFFSALFYLITNRGGQREHVIRNFQTSFTRKISAIKHLPLISKILLILVGVSLLGFGGSVVYLRHTHEKQVESQQYNTLVSTIEEKKNAAEASLLYNDETRALSLIQEAQGYVEQIPKDSPEKEQKAAALLAELQATLSKLQKMTVVTPELKADLATVNPNAKADHFIRLDTSLVISGTNDNSFYFVNLTNNEIKTQLHDTLPTLGSSATPKEQDKAIFIRENDKLAKLDKTTLAFTDQTIAFPSINVKLQAIGLYNRRLYSLDVNNNQIFKHSETLTGYDKGTPWITDGSVDVRDGVSLTIDGDLYILKSNGSIIKLAGGKPQDFEITGVLPALTSPKEIWTSSDAKNIYILEPNQKRIVVLDKQGKFIKQYTSPNWQSPASMSIDEKEKKVYVLDSNKIYSFGL